MQHLTASFIAGAKGNKGGAGKRSLFLLYMDAVSVVNQRSAINSVKGGDQISQPVDHIPAQQTVSFTLRDLHFIVKFAQVLVDHHTQRFQVGAVLTY